MNNRTLVKHVEAFTMNISELVLQHKLDSYKKKIPTFLCVWFHCKGDQFNWVLSNVVT